MKLIRFIDYEGEIHFLNSKNIIAIRPFRPIGDDDNRHSSVEYGQGWMDAIYMSENCEQVANQIAMSTMPRRSTI